MPARFVAVLLLAFSFAIPAAAPAQTSTYAIRANDQLEIIVYGAQGITPVQPQSQVPNPSIAALSQTVTVLSDGTITYPLVGSISVAGLQPDAAAQRIAEALQAYVVHPKVSVIVVKGTPATVEVLGSVDHGGQIELQSGDRVVDAIARAGVGPTSYADLNHITVNRMVDGVPHLYNLNLYHMLLDADYSSNPILQPGDVVYVPKARQYNIANLTNIPFALYYLYLLINPAAGLCCGPK